MLLLASLIVKLCKCGARSANRYEHAAAAPELGLKG